MRDLDPDDNRPPYLQVAAEVQAAVERGDYGPGEKLPTQSELVSTYGVSVATVKKALGTLQSAGLIVSRRGEGAFVKVRQNEPSTQPQSEVGSLRDAVAELAERVDRIELRLRELS